MYSQIHKTAKTFSYNIGVARMWYKGRGAQNCMKLIVARNNTMNKVHAAATELPQLLSQNTICF